MLCLSPMRAESTPVRADSRSTAVNIDCAWLCCAVEPCISQAMLCCRTMCSYLWSSSVWGKCIVKNCSKCTSWNNTSSISRSNDLLQLALSAVSPILAVTSWHASLPLLGDSAVIPHLPLALCLLELSAAWRSHTPVHHDAAFYTTSAAALDTKLTAVGLLIVC